MVSSATMLQARSQGGALAVVRYLLFDEIGAGGMATVHLGRQLGAAGFRRTVAIKRLYPQFVRDPELVAMLLDEARVAARIRHPNVVSTVDVVSSGGEVLLVMEYVHGESLARLLRAATREGGAPPPRIACAVLAGALHGLHAAHEATAEDGAPLHLVHRDVSPHNVLVGEDGVARVLDFGVAKSAGRAQITRDGQLKGKLAYMSPEQIAGEPLDRRADVYAAGVVLWETLTGERLFEGRGEALSILRLLQAGVDPPSARRPGVPPELEAITLRALARVPEDRFPTARAMALALEETGLAASTSEVGDWVTALAGEALAQRAGLIAAIEPRGAGSDPGAAARAGSDPGAAARAGSDPGAAAAKAGSEAGGAAAGAALDAESAAAGAAASSPQPAERRPWAAVAAAGALLAIAAAAVGLASADAPALARAETGVAAAAARARAAPLSLGRALARSGVAPEGAATAPGTAASATAVAVASADPAAPAAPATAVEAAAPAAPASAAATATPAPGSGARRPPRRAPARSGCNPPFIIDGQGHKRYKRECF
ncbi:serine/threonine-protein kinase [Sorangium sp. So ce1097]|uniref:serine/threonine-protein kinase n=1 Tax=Sorangium sp. So ce1097 TaxID=3133330 RepID=UPI003F5FA782